MKPYMIRVGLALVLSAVSFGGALVGCGDRKTHTLIQAAPPPVATPQPTISGVSPSSGSIAGGTTLVITGADLAGVTRVTIGGAALTNLQVQGATSLTGITSATRTTGWVDVTVESAEGTDTLVGAFDYRLQLIEQANFADVGDTPVALRAGNADADGHRDLFVTSRLGLVNVLRGDGTGGIASVTTVTLSGYDTFGLAVGDLDGDQDHDLVVTDIAGHRVLVLHGDGQGAFTLVAPVITNVSSFPELLSLGDLNGDGSLDIAIPIFNSSFGTSPGLVRIIMGDGAGHLAAPGTNYGVLNGPQHSAVGDFDGDGDLDVVVNDLHSTSVTALLNDGSGAFSLEHAPVGSQPGGVIAGDFTGDGKDDVFVLCGNDLPALIDRAPNGRWNLRFITGSGAAHIVGAAADINRDGALDVVAQRFPGPVDEFSVFLGDGQGSFDHHVVASSSPVDAVECADFDGDGLIDVAAMGGTPPRVRIFLNR